MNRSFDPHRLAAAECDAWVAYYRRRWPLVLSAAVRMVRIGFGMPWPQTLHGAWLVLRANRRWAGSGDADGARRTMRRFYALVVRTGGEPFDVDEAARREVEWWRVHRHRRPAADGRHDDHAALVEALTALYAHVYGVAPDAVRPAAVERAAATRISDGWVAAGADPGNPVLADERAALVRSYTALRAAVHRA